MQALLWDRRLVGAVLDHIKVPMPRRLEVSRDGGPKVDDELRSLMEHKLGLKLGGLHVCPEVSLREDGNAIIVDGILFSGYRYYHWRLVGWVTLSDRDTTHHAFFQVSSSISTDIPTSRVSIELVAFRKFH